MTEDPQGLSCITNYVISSNIKIFILPKSTMSCHMTSVDNGWLASFTRPVLEVVKVS